MLARKLKVELYRAIEKLRHGGCLLPESFYVQEVRKA